MAACDWPTDKSGQDRNRLERKERKERFGPGRLLLALS
jgi:hypothetical protein